MARKTDAEKGHVIRISHESYAKLKTLKGQRSFTAAVEALIEAASMVSGPTCYRAGDRVFDNVADARGYAIQLAVRNKQTPTLPDVLVCIGQDSGE